MPIAPAPAPGDAMTLIDTHEDVPGFARQRDLQWKSPVLLCPAEVPKCQTRVPYLGHVGDPDTVELHHVDIVRADRTAGGRNRAPWTGMRPVENSIGGDIVPQIVRRE